MGAGKKRHAKGGTPSRLGVGEKKITLFNPTEEKRRSGPLSQGIGKKDETARSHNIKKNFLRWAASFEEPVHPSVIYRKSTSTGRVACAGGVRKWNARRPETTEHESKVIRKSTRRAYA